MNRALNKLKKEQAKAEAKAKRVRGSSNHRVSRLATLTPSISFPISTTNSKRSSNSNKLPRPPSTCRRAATATRL